MAESVSTAIVQETVSQILSGIVQKYEKKEESNANRNLERLEMAHIRLEAALETSDKWQITDTSKLHWRRKLKRAALECEDTLHKCKKRVLEDEQLEHEVRKSSLPRRIAHATKSFVSSIFNCNNDGLSRSIVQRFEWYADGANEFMRYVELGGTLSEGILSLQDYPYLKAGISFSPHGSSEDMLPESKSSVSVVIVGGDHHCLNTDIALEQLEEIMLPKAICYFCQNAEATVYQMIWRSKHGSALIQVEKPSMSTQRTQRTFGRRTKRKLSRGQDQELGSPTRMMTHLLLDLWVAHIPVRLQRSLMDWRQKEKESDLAV